ncbi:hypothetical protein VNI00_017546 [Paramarasmius palmivorus]|uniref:F-box domain-containing protein n=1 Tax=Paramarasmius palmivorus TaxID=297713 RepID=A0AAW0B6J8_9AGAR
MDTRQANRSPNANDDQPICRCPTEILQKIFLEAVQCPGIRFTHPLGPRISPNEPTTRFTTPFTLAHISSRLRAAVLSCPPMFNRIFVRRPVNCTHHPDSLIECLDFILEHTSTLPIHLVVTVDSLIDNSRHQPHVRTGGYTQCLCLQRILQKPIASIEVEGDSDLIQALFHRDPTFTPTVFSQPTLNTISIDFYTPILSTVTLQILRHLEKEGFTGANFSITIPQSLPSPYYGDEMPSLPLVTSLHYHSCAETLVYTILTFPNITSLTYKCVEVDQPTAIPETPIALPHLLSLVLPATCPSEALTTQLHVVGLIQAPKLQTLTIDWASYTSDMPSTMMAPLEHLLTTSTQLRQVEVIDRRVGVHRQAKRDNTHPYRIFLDMIARLNLDPNVLIIRWCPPTGFKTSAHSKTAMEEYGALFFVEPPSP